MTPTVTAVVLAAAVLHATWNALAHGMRDHLLGFTLMNVSFLTIGLPGVLLSPLPSSRAAGFLVVSAALEVAYQALLLSAYRLGDFAQMYPVARGTAPLLVAVYAGTVLGEPLAGRKLVAVLTICAGLIALAFPGRLPTRAQLPALAYAVGTGICIAGYTVVDGTGVRRADTVAGYIAWLFLLQGVAFIAFARTRRTRTPLRGLPRGEVVRGLGGGVISLVAYGMVVWAQARGTLAAIAALRETSIVVAALIGALAFREPLGRTRLVAGAVVVAGIALLEL